MTNENDEEANDGLDLEAWEPQLPSAGFADAVLARVAAEEQGTAKVVALEPLRPRSRGRTWRSVATAATGGVATLALAAALLVRLTAPPSHGEAIAAERTEVAIGSRALAVLEPGATVRWDGDDVVQPRGAVFYRVEPGARFTVHTPAGDVEVKGTCFGVKVKANDGTTEEAMIKRDVRSGVIGSALTALAFVAVYEGKVAVSHASEHADLAAGESAQMGPNGVRRTGATADGEKDFAESSASRGSDEPLTNANQRLAHQVGEYRSRLEAITAQKADLEAKLKRSEENLSASQDGSTSTKHPFDLSQDDWKELAKDGSMKYRTPCAKAWSPKPENLQALGLSPQDGNVIAGAFTHSSERMWRLVKPLCSQLVSTPEVVERLGTENCMHLVLDAADKTAAMQAVAEIRAGMRPMPGPNENVDTPTKVLLAATGEAKAMEDELAQSFGPEEAHRIMFSDEVCMGQHSWSNGPSKKKPK